MKRRHGRWWVALLLCGCAAEAVDGEPPPPKNEADDAPPVASAELGDVRRMVVDIAARRACEPLRGRLMTLGGEAGEPHDGRLWLRDCRARADGDELALDFEATAWTWADERSGAAGATFRVRQYVFLGAETTLRATPRIEYDRERRHAFLWLHPAADPDVQTRTLGGVDADAEGLWSHVVGGVAWITGNAVDGRAREEVQTEGDRRFEAQVDDGFTLYVDLCSSTVGMEMGRLREIPEAERGPQPATTRARLHAGGLDVHGPIAEGRTEMIAEVEVSEGDAVLARLLCEDEAERTIDAFVAGREPPVVETVGEAQVAPGASREIRGGGAASCRLYLATSVAPGAADTTVAFTVEPAVDDREAMAVGCD